jgi:hypothetical protein
VTLVEIDMLRSSAPVNEVRTSNDRGEVNYDVRRIEVRRTVSDLSALADRVADRDNAGPDLCLVQLDQIRRELYPRGLRAAVSVDDSVVGTGGRRNRILPGPGWARVADWSVLEQTLLAREVGSSVLVFWWRRACGGRPPH